MRKQPDHLTQLLREWNPEPVRVEDVRRHVWRCIEKQKPSPWGAWMVFLETLGDIISRPAVAIGVLAIALTMGLTIGNLASASAQTESYLNSVSPFLHPR